MFKMIIVDGSEINFGKIKFGGSYTRDYNVVNKSQDTVRVENLGKSCTCTSVVAMHPLLAPEEKCTVKVDITPGATGIFSRSFWFDVGGQHYHVAVKAQVE